MCFDPNTSDDQLSMNVARVRVDNCLAAASAPRSRHDVGLRQAVDMTQ
jgi:hypothetical protein